MVDLAHSEQNFAQRCVAEGFSNEEGWSRQRLPIADRSRLQLRAKTLDDQWVTVTTQKKDGEARLVQELEKNLTTESIETLNVAAEILDADLKQIRQDIGAIQQRLADNEVIKREIQKKQLGIDAQKLECRRWESLHALVGSSDGKKYRNFAQGITFEVMVSHANRQLEKMTDRYLLIRDHHQPLELSVIDQYQAGEIRSAKNLSGGESFIVSLALALGLSKMASRNVRVDSLFLDEGFGTLDEAAQEIAIDTLGALQQEGKLIGIISHVAAIKERIGSQIRVRPTSGGRSVLIGPGVSTRI